MKLLGKKVVLGNNRAIIKYTLMLIYVMGFDYTYKNYNMPLWLAIPCFIVLIFFRRLRLYRYEENFWWALIRKCIRFFSLPREIIWRVVYLCFIYYSKHWINTPTAFTFVHEWSIIIRLLGCTLRPLFSKIQNLRTNKIYSRWGSGSKKNTIGVEVDKMSDRKRIWNDKR